MWDCPNCHQQTSENKQYCEHCRFNVGWHFSPWHGIQIASTQLSQRLQWQRDKHAKDVIQPWKGDRPNEEFARAYSDEPDKLTSIYSSKELKKVGMPKLAERKERGV